MNIEEKELDEDLKIGAIRGHIRHQKMLRFSKIDGEMYAWCDQCQRFEKVDKSTAYEAKRAKICPMCFRTINGTTSKGIAQWFYVADGDEKQYGWRINYSLKDGKITYGSAVQVGYWVGKAEYVRGILLTMNGYLGESERWNWRKVNTGYYGFKYLGCFYDLMSLANEDSEHIIWDMMVCNKKSYYQYIASDLNLKSNQIKFISEGVYNRSELEYIKMFNLSNHKQVAKYRSYMAKYYCDDIDRGWNVTHLDYLVRNNIRLRDYADYWDACKIIGRKPDKPKDFKHWHDEVTNAVEIKKNVLVSERIKERSKVLPALAKGEIDIHPLQTYDEVVKVGTALHNCIRTYAERYASGVCELYAITDGGEYKVAIEVKKGKVIQSRGDSNSPMPKAYMKIFKEWEKNLRG